MKTKEKDVIILNYTELVNLLLTVDSGTFVNVTMLTDVRMNKKGNPYFGKVKKLSVCNYLAGNDYEKRVNSNMGKEGIDGSFETQKPFGKTHISKCVLVDDKTGETHYFMMERFDENKPEVGYVNDNFDPIEKELFEQYMVKSYQSKKQEQERKVMVITPKIENIISISIFGKKYVQEND